MHHVELTRLVELARSEKPAHEAANANEGKAIAHGMAVLAVDVLFAAGTNTSAMDRRGALMSFQILSKRLTAFRHSGSL